MPVITIQELNEASSDAASIESFVNGAPADVVPRYGAPYPNQPKMTVTFNNSQIAREATFVASQADKEARFQTFLTNTAYEIPVPYAGGIIVTRMTQTFTYLGELYRPKAGSIPFTTSVWATDSAKLVANGDASLRQDMSNKTNALLGAGLSGWVRTKLADQIENAQQALSGRRVHINEFAKYIPSRVGAPSTWDWTQALIAAQAYLTTSSSGRGVVEFEEQVYLFTQFKRLPWISLEGRGGYSTHFCALPVATTGHFGFMEIAPGAVSGSHMRGISLWGSATPVYGAPVVNANQWGFYSKAQWDAAYTQGGLWFAIHDDLHINNFNKLYWSRGGYTTNNYQRPHQFHQNRGLYLRGPDGCEGYRATGQHGQIAWMGGSCQGLDGNIAELAISFGYDPDPATMADNASGHGESTSDVSGVGAAVQSPYNVSFTNGFTMEKTRRGGLFVGCRNVTFASGTWIERVAQTFELGANAHVTVDASHLANAADGTTGGGVAGSGWLCKVGSGSYFEMTSRNEPIGIIDNYTEATTNLNNVAGLRLQGFAYGDTYQKFKAAGFKTLTINGSPLDMGAHRDIVLNPSASTPSLKLSILKATAAPDENVSFRPLNGPITLDNTGNISLRGRTEITCPQNGLIVLKRIWQAVGNVEWILVSVAEHDATAALADGFYYCADHKTWRRGAVASGSMGWMVTSAGLAGSTLVQKTMPNLSA